MILLLPQHAAVELKCPRLQELSGFFGPFEAKAKRGTPFSILLVTAGILE